MEQIIVGLLVVLVLLIAYLCMMKRTEHFQEYEEDAYDKKQRELEAKFSSGIKAEDEDKSIVQKVSKRGRLSEGCIDEKALSVECAYLIKQDDLARQLDELENEPLRDDTMINRVERELVILKRMGKDRFNKDVVTGDPYLREFKCNAQYRAYLKEGTVLPNRVCKLK